MNRSTYSLDHVVITSSKSFEAVRDAFEAILGPVDEAPYVALASGSDPEKARISLEAIPGSSGLTNFHVYDHGAILRIKNVDRKVLTYVIGNSLFAIEMTQHVVEAALHAPVRVVLYVDDAGLTCFGYDLPSSIFAQYKNAEINKIGDKLDSKVSAAIKTALA